MNRFLKINSLFIALTVLLILFSCQAAAHSYTITIAAGNIDRSESIVSFHFPESVDQGVYNIIDESGNSIFLQVDGQNQGWFILEYLSAGENRTYQFDNKPVTIDHTVLKSIDSNTFTFRVDGNDVISYFHGNNHPPESLDERYTRGGYIHPVRSPNGAIITNHLDPEGHPHHSGIWSAWTNTKFQGRTPDFWNVHDNTGRVDQQDSLDIAWDGPIHAGFRAQHYFVDLSASAPVIALNEEWIVRVYPSVGGKNIHVFDLIVTQTTNTSQPLILPEYRYGGVGFRGHPDWDDPDNATFLSSEGLGRNGHGTRVRWSHIGGYSEGELAGISILSHPENYRHPQTVRIHPDRPFFNYAPVQLGDMAIESSSPYVVQYRHITYDREPNHNFIDKMWEEYASSWRDG